MKGFEVFWRLIDGNLAADIYFIIVPCEHSRLTAMQHDVMLLIHLGQLGIDCKLITSRKDTD